MPSDFECILIGPTVSHVTEAFLLVGYTGNGCSSSNILVIVVVVVAVAVDTTLITQQAYKLKKKR